MLSDWNFTISQIKTNLLSMCVVKFKTNIFEFCSYCQRWLSIYISILYDILAQIVPNTYLSNISRSMVTKLSPFNSWIISSSKNQNIVCLYCVGSLYTVKYRKLYISCLRLSKSGTKRWNTGIKHQAYNFRGYNFCNY
jgi:hypothetical protein